MTDDRCDLLCLDAPRAEAIREGLIGGEIAYGAAERAKALSNPTRLTLAAALRGAGEDGRDPSGGELCVCDLAWISGRAQNLVSHHMRTLRSHGLVRSRRDGKLVMYSLTGEGLSLLSAVLGDASREAREPASRA
ncbi:MAG: regulatory protein, ArsR [uncultured Rubrobacteraceae bacterium]|uniref:Regulatory protein, ArsR n=1 Tax=uncultured Rubrobacteraceae bacterium TaxID=349277 RepID=A0A6J4P0L8_9ACTN|nr:MAG: regulatory protein, ArsR [uncultured Rubrobacteraceae bacterium]